MQEKGITAYRLAKDIGVHPSTIKNWLDKKASPQIIDKKTWNEVQRIMDSRKNTGSASKREYLLAGRVWCECGTKMHASTTTSKGHEYPHYSCPAKCGMRSISADDVDKDVFDYFAKLMTPSNMDKIDSAFHEYIKNTRNYQNDEK